LLDEVPAAAVLPKTDDDPKRDDCGVVVVVVAAGVCPNENENPETGVPFAVVVVVAAGVLLVGFTENENLGVVVVVLSPVLALGGALVVGIDVDEIPFPNTTLLGASVELLPNTLSPNMFGVWVCCIPKGEVLVLLLLFENAVVVFVLPPPNADF